VVEVAQVMKTMVFQLRVLQEEELLLLDVVAVYQEMEILSMQMEIIILC
jgi:hypothetical protein